MAEQQPRSNLATDRFIPAGYNEGTLIEHQEDEKKKSFLERFKRGGLVSLGAAATAGVLSYGIYNFQAGSPSTSARYLLH